MPEFMIVVQFENKVDSYFSKFSETVSNMCEMFRSLEHPYEVYHYDPEYGYVRTARWPAA